MYPKEVNRGRMSRPRESVCDRLVGVELPTMSFAIHSDAAWSVGETLSAFNPRLVRSTFSWSSAACSSRSSVTSAEACVGMEASATPANALSAMTAHTACTVARLTARI